ncbi:FkbM family methyltransferase [Dolichospermum sp. LEGE 00246]|uniref:FkbM family methyltransferase n=1 Tax=Dolichospermum sp. LEGE 00246 TaxID=1828605 RepID=UPI001882C4BC|nr:FkbM family methyltransferase [Dolichospermum sp. LEGE 00246]MBE9255829.1 FkbM family methyltransferase [Dolichospermum sp. LEGE 00246]
MGYLRRKMIEGLTRFVPTILPAQRQYYNETNNDRWIAEYVFPNKQDGYFLEVGAANGREVSSCYVLEKEFGWKGICVEPSDYFFEQLVRNRPNSICEQVCLSNQVGTVTFIEGSDETVSPYLSGIKSNLETVKYQGKEVVAKGKEVKKEAVTLEVLLKKYHAPQVIDYAAFDIEGSELDVLEVFPFESYVFLALSLECDGSIRLPISQLLESNGYQRAKNPLKRDKPWEMYWLHQSVY